MYVDDETWKQNIIERNNRIAEGKVPACAAMCATNALMIGTSEKVSELYRTRVLARGQSKEASNSYIWNIAYSKQGRKGLTQ